MKLIFALLKVAGAALAVALASQANQLGGWLLLLLAFLLTVAFVVGAASAISGSALGRRFPRIAMGVMAVLPLLGASAAFALAR
jgi:hypothetical protein